MKFMSAWRNVKTLCGERSSSTTREHSVFNRKVLGASPKAANKLYAMRSTSNAGSNPAALTL
jgi:hypothetical protein